MQNKEIWRLIIIKNVSMAAILETLECKRSEQMVRRVISVIPNRCGLKVNDKLAGRQNQSATLQWTEKHFQMWLWHFQATFHKAERVVHNKLNWTGWDRTAASPAEMAVVSQLRRLVKITRTMVKCRKKRSPSRGLTFGGPQPSVGSTAIITHILPCEISAGVDSLRSH